MTTNEFSTTTQKQNSVLWIAVALALLTALAYLLIALNVLGTGDYPQSEGPVGIVYTAAGCYLVGGLLILARRRWLWVIGALINAAVMLFFFIMYKNQPGIIFSPGGLATKIPQLLLEAALLYLIIAYRARPGK